MDSNEQIVSMRQMIMQGMQQHLQEIAHRVSPNLEVHVNWSLDDPLDVPAAPVKKAAAPKQKAPKKRKAAKAKTCDEVSRAERKAFYMCNYWRKKKGETPLSYDEWQQSKKDTSEKN
jgi:hypothetical protein